jgi:hypothetical protein
VDHPQVSEPSLAEGSATALGKYHCPACGAEATWNPAKRALICAFCGTESPAELKTIGADTVIVEHDLVTALRDIPDSARGWEAKKTSVKCQSCQAISVFDADTIAKRCDFCGSAALVAYEEVKEAFRPESLLPLKISEANARELIRAWYGRQWFAPNALKKEALTDTVHAVYLPYWTFDAQVDGQWTADRGEYYYTGSGKNRRRNVRWTPASGEVSHFFDDDLVCASTGVPNARLKLVEPFPTTELVPYDAGYLAGWTVERYQLDLVSAAQRSRAQMDAQMRALCSDQVGGDTQRNLQVVSTYSGQTFKHILAPVWLLTYVYRTSSYQVLINGVTGQIAGSRPWSWIKIAFAILCALIVLSFFLYLKANE